MSEETTAQPQPPPPDRPPRLSPRLILGLAIGGGILGIAILVLLGILIARSVRPPGEPTALPTAAPTEVTRLPTSVLPTPVPPPIAEVGSAQVPLAVPTLLEVGGRSFPVMSSEPGGDDPWAGFQPEPGGAIWMYGTVVHYVLGLEPSQENLEMIIGLGRGDPVLLRLSSGARLTFRVAETAEVDPKDPALMSQRRPGLTLVLPGPEAWSVVRADFEAATEPTLPPGAAASGVGQAVQVGGVQVTVVEGHAERGGAGLDPGMMIYFVEFSVRNTGDDAVLTTGFLMTLEDSLGNVYAPSVDAAGAGRYGPLPEVLGPGQEASGTAAYVVPDTLPGPSLTWTFGLAASEVRARFAIPYSPPAASQVLPEVRVTEAFLAEGGFSLHVVAEIHNPGTGPLTVTADDVTLSSSAGPGELQMAAPPFPWVIAAGDTREVELRFARPDAAQAIVTILGYTFEISGIH